MRIIDDSQVVDEFVARLAAKARALPVGDPRNGPVVLGVVCDMNTATCRNALISAAINKEATLVCGGMVESALMPATLLGNVTPEIHVYHKATSWPDKRIVCTRSDEENIAHVNDDEYGLSAAIFRWDTACALNVAAGIQSGICHINGRADQDVARMPLGGVKNNGIGRFGCKAGIAEFTLTCAGSMSRRRRAVSHSDRHHHDSTGPGAIRLPLHAKPLIATTKTGGRPQDNLFPQAVSVLPPIH